MYFLFEYLASEPSLLPHQTWILLLLLVATLVFSAAASGLRDEQGRREASLIITAAFLWSLSFERVMIALWYQFMIYPEHFPLLPIWRLLRHLSLAFIELSLYAGLFALLKARLKRVIKRVVGRWLSDA